jgi:hypothetical protein
MQSPLLDSAERFRRDLRQKAERASHPERGIAVRLSTGVLRQRRIGWAFAVAAGALVVSPLTAAAGLEQGGSRATTGRGRRDRLRRRHGAGLSRRGRDEQERAQGRQGHHRHPPRVHLGRRFHLARDAAMSVSKKRKFGASFGPVTSRNDDGTTTDFEGSDSGAFNKARTKASGKWSLKATDRDASGAVTDTCDSGSINSTVKQ